jgi:hypothetical protein
MSKATDNHFQVVDPKEANFAGSRQRPLLLITVKDEFVFRVALIEKS